MKLRNKNTGEVIDLDVANIKAQFGGISVIPEPVKLGGDEYVYHSLSELNDEWEDYSPKEPLIKDEKIRKAVRAWSEVVGEYTFIVSYNMEHHDCCIYTSNLSDTATIDFGIDLNLKEGSYTIYELCGEEE